MILVMAPANQHPQLSASPRSVPPKACLAQARTAHQSVQRRSPARRHSTSRFVRRDDRLWETGRSAARRHRPPEQLREAGSCRREVEGMSRARRECPSLGCKRQGRYERGSWHRYERSKKLRTEQRASLRTGQRRYERGSWHGLTEKSLVRGLQKPQQSQPMI